MKHEPEFNTSKAYVAFLSCMRDLEKQAEIKSDELLEKRFWMGRASTKLDDIIEDIQVVKEMIDPEADDGLSRDIMLAERYLERARDITKLISEGRRQ
jgi:hypothetical protein